MGLAASTIKVSLLIMRVLKLKKKISLSPETPGELIERAWEFEVKAAGDWAGVKSTGSRLG